MTVPITLNNLANLQNETTAVNTINANNTSIATAFTTALSTQGDQMTGTLDMNGGQILNLPSPATAHSPVRLQDVTTSPLISSVPPVGTSGGVVGLLNGNNTISGNNTHTGIETFSNTVTLSSPSNLGTPSAAVLTNATGLPLASVTGFGTGISTFLATPTSANLRTAMTDETGTGSNVFATSPSLVTPNIGAATGTSVALTGGGAFFNATAVPSGGTSGSGITLSSVANLGIFFGSGVPTLSAAQGSLYIRTDGSSTSTRMYINTNGSTTWTNVTTAA